VALFGGFLPVVRIRSAVEATPLLPDLVELKAVVIACCPVTEFERLVYPALD
jgi:hypothetical protein